MRGTLLCEEARARGAVDRLHRKVVVQRSRKRLGVVKSLLEVLDFPGQVVRASAPFTAFASGRPRARPIVI